MSRKVSTQLVIEGKNNSGKAFAEVKQELDSLDRKLSAAGKAVAGLLSVQTFASAVRSIGETADAYNLMNARLKLATGSQEAFNVAQAGLADIAKRTESPMASLVTLYGRISRPLQEAGRSQKEVLKVTEAVATAFRVSGASAQEAENGVIQFAQALGAGALRGDEFNSVAEQAPRLMQALADGIGVPVGALKEMAAQGLLTAEVVTDALTSQLDVLRAEAESLPKTVGGAMTDLADRWNQAIGQADMTPLIEAIKQLGTTLSDPVVVDNLVRLASALTSLAAAAVSGASEFTDLGKRIGFVAANAVGAVTELDKIDQQLLDIERSLNGTGLNTTLAGMFYSKEELEAQREALQALRATLLQEVTGMTADMEEQAKIAAAAAEKRREEELKSYSGYLGELKKLQDQQVKSAADAIKKQAAAEKVALRELEKVKEDRLKIESRYREALNGLTGGGEASYAGAQDLKAKANQALKANNPQAAQQYAQAALKMLQDLQAAGENTYGFEGFIKSLQAIEMAANDIEQTNAEAKLQSIRDTMESLKTKAAELKDSPVSFKLDEASVQALRSQIEALAAELGEKLVLPVAVAKPSADQPASVPGFATGGLIRGPGSGTSDSILARLSNGEFVMKAAAVRHYGPQFLAMLNGLQLPKFATGGLVGDMVANAPMAGPASIGTVNLTLPGGESYTLQAQPDQFDRILRRTALKFGRR